MAKIILILLAALILEAMGVVFLSSGLRQIGELRQFDTSEIVRVIGKGATNRSILIGIMLEAVFFGALIYLLSQRDVSFIWPLTSLGFVITALAARFLRHEEVSMTRWVGVCIIVMGAMLVAWSEKVKERNASVGPEVSGSRTEQVR